MKTFPPIWQTRLERRNRDVYLVDMTNEKSLGFVMEHRIETLGSVGQRDVVAHAIVYSVILDRTFETR